MAVSGDGEAGDDTEYGSITIKLRRRIGGMNSGMPGVPARLSWVVVQPARRAHGGLL